MTTTQNSSPKATVQDQREAVRKILDRRYHGVIPVTDEMIDAVMEGQD